ncbi:MAG: hypothetical protein RIC87_06115 [Kiloniellales bacterium]
MTDTVRLQFCSSNRALALGQHRAFVEGIKEKLFPAFDNIEEEADRLSDEAYQRLVEIHGNEDGPDIADIAESAIDDGVVKFESLIFVKGQLSGLAIAGTYHLWEKTLKAFFLRELSHHYMSAQRRRNVESANYNTLAGWLGAMGVTLGQKAYREDLETCRLIANTIKHGDGPSCQKLAKHAPNVLRGPYGDIFGFSEGNSDNLWIEPRSFEQLASSIEEFWRDLPDDMVVSASVFD